LKLGTENRTKVIAVSVLGVVALLMLVRALSSPEPSAPKAGAPVAGTTRPNMKRTASGKLVKITEPRLDPTLQLDLLAQSEQTKYAGNGRNIFANYVAPIPTPKGNGTLDTPAFTPPPPAPPPPITLKFFGFASKPGEPKRIFLSQGDDIFIAGEGDIIDRRYRILHISPSAVDVEDVLNNNHQSIPLTQG
jgi:hypothetical protein